MPLKILHTADLHVGMTFKNRHYPEDVREKLVEARFESLEKLVALAGEEKCQLLIIAGDLFHRANVAAGQVIRVVETLKRFDGLTAVLPGNHDYYESQSQLWSVMKEKAFDDLILLNAQRPYNLSDYGIEAVLYPAPCDSKHSADNRVSWIGDLADRPEGIWHIGVAHGAVSGVSPDFNKQYYPMEESELARLKLDLWCLGHTHICYPDVEETGSQIFLYCGTPEPDGFDCRHRGNAWITELDEDGGHRSRMVKTGRYCFREIEKKIQSRCDFESLQNDLKAEGPNTLVKLKLSGTLPEDDYKTRSSFYREIETALFYLEINDSDLIMEITPQVIDSKYAQGSFPYRLLMQLSEKDNREALQLAYRLVEEVKK